MNKLIKLFGGFLTILCLLAIFTSCDKGSDEEEYRYMFGLTSAINSKNEEIEAIESAYCDAYKIACLKFGAQLFAPGTSKDLILKACSEAEYAILTSSIKFEGRYTYKIKCNGYCIYHKNFGTR